MNPSILSGYAYDLVGIGEQSGGAGGNGGGNRSGPSSGTENSGGGGGGSGVSGDFSDSSGIVIIRNA